MHKPQQKEYGGNNTCWTCETFYLLCRPSNSRLCIILWWIVRVPSETPQKKLKCRCSQNLAGPIGAGPCRFPMRQSLLCARYPHPRFIEIMWFHIPVTSFCCTKFICCTGWATSTIKRMVMALLVFLPLWFGLRVGVAFCSPNMARLLLNKGIFNSTHFRRLTSYWRWTRCVCYEWGRVKRSMANGQIHAILDAIG